MHFPADRNRRRIAAFPQLDAADAPPICIDGLTPDSGGGRTPVKRVCDEPLRVEADIFAPPGSVAVSLNWRRRGETLWESMPMLPLAEGGVRHGASLTFPKPGVFEYAVGIRFSNGAAVITRDPPEVLIVETVMADRGAWIDLEPANLRGWRFAECAPLLDTIALAGFDVIALPPITLADAPMQIDPTHGTLKDFDQLVRMARQRGLEPAMTPQISTERFYEGADWQAQLDRAWATLRFWAARGIRVFRFDEESVKISPLGFWRKLLSMAREQYPDFHFSAVPGPTFSWKMRIALAKIGFSSIHFPMGAMDKAALKKAVFELSRPEIQDVFRPGLRPEFSYDPGEHLMHFKVRTVLTAAISPSWGLPAAIVLGERASASTAFLTQFNQIRREHPALREPAQTVVCHCRDRNVVALLKTHSDGSSLLVVALLKNTGKFAKDVDIQFPRATGDARFTIRDLFSGQSEAWRGAEHAIEINAGEKAVRIFQVDDENSR